MTRPATILIAGPTASGKSALAIALAERLDGVVVNADSMQVYRDLRVLTARPTAEDERKVPHRLFGHVDAADAYSAGRFLTDAAALIAEARSSSRVAIFVGGTGLYFKALLEGLAPVPPIPESVRARWRQEVARRGPEHAHAVLAARDPVMAARLSPSDSQRITRALEVLDATGRSLAEWQNQRTAPLVGGPAVLKLALAPPREELHRRADARFAAMVEAGAIDEVAALLSRRLDHDLPALRAIGVGPIRRFLAGSLNREAMIAAGQAETRQYIKRQTTWLRGNFSSWKWLSSQSHCENCDQVFALIDV